MASDRPAALQDRLGAYDAVAVFRAAARCDAAGAYAEESRTIAFFVSR